MADYFEKENSDGGFSDDSIAEKINAEKYKKMKNATSATTATTGGVVGTETENKSGVIGERDHSPNSKSKSSNNNEAKNSTEKGRKKDQLKEEVEESDWNFLDSLPPSQPIVVKDYGLEADMLFGWQPKTTFTGPVPMTFSQSRILILIHNLLSNSKSIDVSTTTIPPERYQLIYLGFRPNNSVDLHSAFSDTNVKGAYPFKFMQVSKKISGFNNMIEAKTKSNQLPFQGMNPLLKANKLVGSNNNSNSITGQWNSTNNNTRYTKCSIATNNQQQTNATVDSQVFENYLHFDAFFESGNLDCVVQVKPNEYDLFMRVDSNTKGHLSWFYFKVSKGKKNQSVKFNICNFTKHESLYTRGMKPYMLSQKKSGGVWKQAGEKVAYSQKEWRYQFMKEESQEAKPSRQYYTLSFEYTFEVDDDVVSFAYSPPYTFTMLLNFIQELSAAHRDVSGNFLKESKLCSTVGGLDVPVLTITEYNDNSSEVIQKRKMVIVSARIHPGEANSSYLMHGFLLFLCSKQAAELRRKCVFKIVPMMNPDGVILGNFRTGIAGRDLNRVFSETDKFLFPTVAGLKDLVSEAQQKHGVNNVAMFLDFHGHSLKKNVFTFGPDYPIYHTNYYKTRLFSKILARRTNMFRYFSCIFRLSQMKKNTARGVFFKSFNIPNCFTVEASNGSFYKGLRDTQEFNTELWSEVGVHIAQSIDEYVQTIIDYEKWQARQIKLHEQTASITSSQTTTASDSSFGVLKNNVQKLSARGDRSPNQIDEGNTSRSTSEISSHASRQSSKRQALSQKQVKRNSKNIDPSLLLDKDSPFAAFFGDENQEKQSGQNGNESDEYSEKGLDSDSGDEDDYDRVFLKSFKVMMQANSELVSKYFAGLDINEYEKSNTRRRSKGHKNKTPTNDEDRTATFKAATPATFDPSLNQHSISPLNGFISRFKDPRPPTSLLLNNNNINRSNASSAKQGPPFIRNHVEKSIKKFISEERKQFQSQSQQLQTRKEPTQQQQPQNQTHQQLIGYNLPIPNSPTGASRSAMMGSSNDGSSLVPLSNTSNLFEINLPSDHLKAPIKRNENSRRTPLLQAKKPTFQSSLMFPPPSRETNDEILGNKVIVLKKKLEMKKLEQLSHCNSKDNNRSHSIEGVKDSQFFNRFQFDNESLVNLMLPPATTATAAPGVGVGAITDRSLEIYTTRESQGNYTNRSSLIKNNHHTHAAAGSAGSAAGPREISPPFSNRMHSTFQHKHLHFHHQKEDRYRKFNLSEIQPQSHGLDGTLSPSPQQQQQQQQQQGQLTAAGLSYNISPLDYPSAGAAALAKRYLNYQITRSISPIQSMLIASAKNSKNHMNNSANHPFEQRRKLISITPTDFQGPGQKVNYPPYLYKIKMNRKQSSQQQQQQQQYQSHSQSLNQSIHATDLSGAF